MSMLDTETKRKLREMNASELLDAIDGQDQSLTISLPFEERVRLAVDDAYAAFTRPEPLHRQLRRAGKASFFGEGEFAPLKREHMEPTSARCADTVRRDLARRPAEGRKPTAASVMTLPTRLRRATDRSSGPARLARLWRTAVGGQGYPVDRKSIGRNRDPSLTRDIKTESFRSESMRRPRTH